MADVFGSSSDEDETTTTTTTTTIEKKQDEEEEEEKKIEKKSDVELETKNRDVFGGSSSEEEEDEEKRKKKKDGDDEFDDFDDVKGNRRIVEMEEEDLEASRIQGPSSTLYAIKQSDTLKFRPEAFVREKYDQNRIDYEDKKYGVAMGQVVRWKENKEDGKVVSNARIVEWSDGTMMLQVGNNFFKMKQQIESSKDHNYVYLQQKYRIKDDKSDENGKTYLQSHGKIHTKVTFQSIGENVKTKKLLKIKEQTLVESRVKTIVAGDANAERVKMLKQAQEEERRKSREAQLQRAQTNAQIEAMKRKMAMIEEEELSDSALDAGETQAMSINDLKKSTLSKNSADLEKDVFGDDDSDSDDSDDEDFQVSGGGDKKNKNEDDDDNDEMEVDEDEQDQEEEKKDKDENVDVEVEVDDDDEEEEETTVKQDENNNNTEERPKKRARRVIDDDDDDSD